MTISLGKECYRLGESPCQGSGWKWTEKELDEALKGKVSSLLFDDTGVTEIKDMLTGIDWTEFDKKKLSDVLSGENSGLDEVENWRVGEAIADAYLTEHKKCIFPWPIGRDSRKK